MKPPISLKKTRFQLHAGLGLVCGIWLFLNNNLRAQPAGTANFLNQVKNYNLQSLWRAGSLRLLSLKQNEPFPEPYGTLGKNYQRFYIHYTSVTKNQANPYCYQVQGKTRVGNKVQPFTGTITVTQAGLYKPGTAYTPETYKGYKRGQLICNVSLTETGQTPGAETIKGVLTTNFCINAQNQLLYDTLDFGIDGYLNNYFTGTLTNSGKPAQKLNYGDFNLLGSVFSDVGGITVPPEYEKYGWQSFVNAIPNDIKPAGKAAVAEEKRQWWR
ncbi:MAG: hypothetical protein EOP41_05465 [Sphingobacteriaceae bacterium]|nr:MAG: hypothetical protein EOP41_05465 [Sphingobacteriaceae bacterium]